MLSFFQKALAFLFGCEETIDDRPQPTTESERIVSDIRKWEARAADYERLGCLGLARDAREQVAWYRKLAAARPGARKVHAA